MITGVSLPICRRWRSVSSPSSRGMRRSRRISSTGELLRASRAASPSVAAMTSKPSASRVVPGHQAETRLVVDDHDPRRVARESAITPDRAYAGVRRGASVRSLRGRRWLVPGASRPVHGCALETTEDEDVAGTTLKWVQSGHVPPRSAREEPSGGVDRPPLRMIPASGRPGSGVRSMECRVIAISQPSTFDSPIYYTLRGHE